MVRLAVVVAGLVVSVGAGAVAAPAVDEVALGRALVVRGGLAMPSSGQGRIRAAGGVEYELRPNAPTGSWSVSAHAVEMQSQGSRILFSLTANHRWWTRWSGDRPHSVRLFAGLGGGGAYTSAAIPELGFRSGLSPVWTIFAGVEIQQGWQVEGRVMARDDLGSSVSGVALGYRF